MNGDRAALIFVALLFFACAFCLIYFSLQKLDDTGWLRMGHAQRFAWIVGMVLGLLMLGLTGVVAWSAVLA